MGILDTPGVPSSRSGRLALSEQTMVVLGDSLTDQGGMTVSTPNLTPFSAWTWANVLLGQRFSILANAGVSGETTSQIRARMSSVLAFRPGWVHLLAGTNNVGAVGGLAQAKVDIAAMLDTFAAQGIKVILGTLPPRLSGNYTGTIKADTFDLNAWIVNQAKLRPGVVLADYFSALADGTAGNYLSTIAGWSPTSDGVHLSATGGFICGKVLADAVRGLTAPATFYGNPSPGPNLLADPRFVNGSSGSAPSSWTIAGNASGSVTWSKVARTDIPDSWRQVVVPTGSASLTIQANANIGASLAVGERVVGLVEFGVTALDQAATSGFQGLMLHLKAYNGSVFTTTLTEFSNYAQPNWSRTGVLRTPVMTIPSGTTIVSLFIEIAGGGTYQFDRAGVYKADTYTSI